MKETRSFLEKLEVRKKRADESFQWQSEVSARRRQNQEEFPCTRHVRNKSNFSELSNQYIGMSRDDFKRALHSKFRLFSPPRAARNAGLEGA